MPRTPARGRGVWGGMRRIGQTGPGAGLRGEFSRRGGGDLAHRGAPVRRTMLVAMRSRSTSGRWVRAGAGVLLGAHLLAACASEPDDDGEEPAARERLSAPLSLRPAIPIGEAEPYLVLDEATIEGESEIGTLVLVGEEIRVAEGVLDDVVIAGEHVDGLELGLLERAPAFDAHSLAPRRGDWLDAVDAVDLRWRVVDAQTAIWITRTGRRELSPPIDVSARAMYWDGFASRVARTGGEGGGHPPPPIEGAGASHAGGATGGRAIQGSGFEPRDGDPCTSTSMCPDGEVCVIIEVDGGGVAVCQAACYGETFENFWCVDDDACCDADASCVNGHCDVPGGSDEDSTGDGSMPDDSGGGGGSSGGCSNGPDLGCGDAIMDGCNACAETPGDIADGCGCGIPGRALGSWVPLLGLLVLRGRRPRRRRRRRGE